MRFSPARFNRFLGGAVRQNFTWRRAFACPCVSPHSGAARADCPLCGALGWSWQAGVDVHAGMTNLSPQKAMQIFGVWEPGDAMLTVPADSPLYAAGRHDRIRASAATSPFSQVITPDFNERLVGGIVSIERVYWIDDDGETIVEGGIPTVNDDGSLTWTEGAPPEGRSYSITGRRYDELFVFRDLPSNRNSGVTGLPRKLLVRKFDLFGRAGGNEDAIS